MAFINLTRDLIENVTISLTPNIKYISGSLSGITGSVKVLPLSSKCFKEVRTISSVNASPFDDSENDTTSLTPDQLLDFASNTAASNVKENKTINITRLEMPVTFSSGSIIKRNIQHNLMPYYQHIYDDCGYYYRNYHALNFFTGSNFNTGSVILYPNTSTQDYPYSNFKPLSCQFWINPRYKNGSASEEFHAGTILHLSSSLCISLISGLGRDQNGLVNTYKILAQYKNTAEISPHEIDLNKRDYPKDLWVTSSFELKYNNWHHVTFRWSPTVNNNTGSLIVDNQKTEFILPSSSILNANKEDIKALCIGNFYKGNSATQASFFNDTSKINEGTITFGESSDPSEANYSFDNPLNAEVHEIKLYNSFLTNSDLLNTGSGVKKEDITEKGLSFYLPPYYYPESGKQQYIYDGTFKVLTSSHTPINQFFAFSKNGKEVNLQNFTRELVHGNHPRLFHLTSSKVNSYSDADQYMFETPSNTKRNLTILPNDNGQFSPNYFAIENLSTGSLDKHFSSGALGVGINYDLIKIENQLLSNKFSTTQFLFNNSIFEDILGGVTTTSNSDSLEADTIIKIQNNYESNNNSKFPLALAEDVKDDSSNYISIFNISNLYYGNKIHPGSFEVIESALTGSQNKIKIKLRDNERGGLYRADCLTKQASWNVVGNIFYNEGMVIVKNPHLPLFGKDKFEMNFKGEQNVHSMVINVPASRASINSSNNVTFTALPKSSNTNDERTEAICITGINIHDSDFNIIMRAKLAQPILKDNSDEFVVRLKMDF